MNDSKIIQNYINNLRRHLSPYLRANIGVSSKVFPAEQNGAIIEISLGPSVANEDTFMPIEPTVNEALGKIEQKAFGGNLAGFRFGGTNVIMEDNRIVLIKGEDDPLEWGDNASQSDVNRILPSKAGGPK